MDAPCRHLVDVPADPMPDGGCEECVKIGSGWVHLRYCVTCGRILCCDSSPNRHASRHAADSGHPVIRSKEPGDNWAWCYVDEVVVATAQR